MQRFAPTSQRRGRSFPPASRHKSTPGSPMPGVRTDRHFWSSVASFTDRAWRLPLTSAHLEMEDCMRKLLLAVGVVLVAGIGYASAAPIRPIVASVDDGIVLAACNPGTPNCVKPSGNRPTFCGGVTNP